LTGCALHGASQAHARNGEAAETIDGLAKFRSTPVAGMMLVALDALTGKELYSSGKLLANWVHFNQPVVARGEHKRLLELTVDEAGPAFVAAGLITQEQLERIVIEMRRLSTDESVLAVMPRTSRMSA
jgi:hypothetical protein